MLKKTILFILACVFLCGAAEAEMALPDNGADVPPAVPGHTYEITAKVLSVTERFSKNISVLINKEVIEGATELIMEIQILTVARLIKEGVSSIPEASRYRVGQVLTVRSCKETDVLTKDKKIKKGDNILANIRTYACSYDKQNNAHKFSYQLKRIVKVP